MSLNPLQDRIKARLARIAYFTTPRSVPVVTVDDGDILTKILEKTSALDGGLAICVLTPVGQNGNPDLPGVNLTLQVEIAVVEISVINRAATGLQKPSYEAARKLMRPVMNKGEDLGGLHFWEPGAPFAKLKLQSFEEVTATVKGKGLLVYRVMFECREIIN